MQRVTLFYDTARLLVPQVSLSQLVGPWALNAGTFETVE